MGGELEAGARSPHLDALGLHRHGHSRRGRGFMRNIDMCAEAAFAGIEMRLEELHAGPFHKSDHEAGGEHLRHGLKLRRLAIEMRDGLGLGHAIGEAVPEPRLKRRFHDLSLRSLASPAFSSPGIAVSMPSHRLRKSKLRYSCWRLTGS